MRYACPRPALAAALASEARRQKRRMCTRAKHASAVSGSRLVWQGLPCSRKASGAGAWCGGGGAHKRAFWNMRACVGVQVLYSKFGFMYTEVKLGEEDFILIREQDVIGIMPRSSGSHTQHATQHKSHTAQLRVGMPRLAAAVMMHVGTMHHASARQPLRRLGCTSTAVAMRAAASPTGPRGRSCPPPLSRGISGIRARASMHAVLQTPRRRTSRRSSP